LVEDIRGLVVSRAFAAQRRPIDITPVEAAEVPEESQSNETEDSGKKKKRRRH